MSLLLLQNNSISHELQRTQYLTQATNEIAVVNMLENQTNPKDPEQLAQIFNTLDYISCWLYTECRSGILKHEKQDILKGCNKLKEVQKRLQIVIKDLKKTIKNHEQRNYNGADTLVCSVCKAVIEIENGKNTWQCLEEHDHIEQQYVAYLNKENNSDDIAETVHDIVENINKLNLQDNNILSKPTADNSICEKNAEIKQNITKNSGVLDKILNKPIPNNICIENAASSSCNAIENKQNTAKTSNNLKENKILSKPTPDNSFRFNFQVNYDNSVKKILYPEEFSRKVRNIDFVPSCTIQCFGMASVYCLLCSCSVSSGPKKVSFHLVKIHLTGQKHLRLAANEDTKKILSAYHNNWDLLEPSLQAHQVFFEPINVSQTICTICNCKVYYVEIILHINSVKHKGIFLNKREELSMYEEFKYILDKQSEVYNVSSNGKRDDSNSESESDISRSTSKTSTEENSSVANSPIKSTDNKKLMKHDIVVSVSDPTSNNILDLIENRFKNHLNQFQVTRDSIICIPCQIDFQPPNLNLIKKHILTKDHCTGCGIFNKKYTFHCEICNNFYKSERTWEEHMKHTAHNAKCQNLGVSRRGKLKEYECKTCAVVIFGDSLSLTRHQSLYRSRHTKKEIKLPDSVKTFFKTQNALNSEAEKLNQEAVYVLNSNDDVVECCRALELALSEAYPTCKAYPFGSRVSGLGNKVSDLDIFMDIGGMYNGDINQDGKSQEKFVKSVSKEYRKKKNNIFSHINSIPTARTPIIQIFHTPTKLDCDLSFKNGLSVENTKYLMLSVDLQPVTRTLILILKKWSAYCKLNEHITTYALSMMVIFYLQVNNYLLSVKAIRSMTSQPSLFIGGWETLEYPPLEILKEKIKPYTNSTRDSLKDFFAFYMNFNFANDVICPLLGHCIPKTSFHQANGVDLPPDMHTYVEKINTDPEPEYFRALSPLCIQDPFDLSHNLTKACQPGTVDKFKKLCDLTYKHLITIN